MGIGSRATDQPERPAVVRPTPLRRLRMSFLIASTQAVAAAAGDLAGIGSTISDAAAAAAAPTTGVLAAGADEISAAVAAVFGTHAQQYQSLSAQAEAFHAQ